MRGVARRLGRAIAHAPPIAVLAAGWLVLVIYAYPGQLTQDSYDHLREVRDGIWTDAHPPAMNLIWKLADYVVAGPFGMLVIQATLVVTGLYLVLRRALEPRGAAWAATGLLLYPPVFVVLPVIWKDSPMTGFLLIGAVLLFHERRSVRIAGLLSLGVATALRYNAFGATFPLILLAFEWEPGMRWLSRYAIAAAAWLAITVAAFAFNAAITDRPMHSWHSTLALFDIVGTLAFVDEDIPDAELEKLFEGTDVQVHTGIHDAIRRVYKPADFLPIVSQDKYPILWKVPINGYEPAPEAQRDAIARAYVDVLTGHPAAYLKHRVTVMGEVLWLAYPRPAAAIRSRAFAFPDYHKSLGMGTGWSTLQHKMTRWVTWFWKKTPLFLPWVYALLAVLLLPFVFRQRDLLALVISGFGLELSLLPLAATPDYRYSHWMVLTTCLAAIMLTARRARGVGITDRPSRASAPR